MKAIVLSYTNPDLDGIASALAIEALFGTPWEASVSGVIDKETDFVLRRLGMSPPRHLQSWQDIAQIWLVDTHHLRQLPPDLPTTLVVRVTDHHPGGNPSSFPNAEIQNDTVGAVATLVAEQFEAKNVSIPPNIAVLLQAAILSNTLEFKAPSTSSRDQLIYKKLEALEPIAATLIDGMRECRRGILSLRTEQLVRSDIKTFDSPNGIIIIGQIEAPGASEVLARPDLICCLRSLAIATKASSAILNVVDTVAGTSGVIATDSNVAGLLAKSLQATLGKDRIIYVNRVLQRKSDILPVLLSHK